MRAGRKHTTEIRRTPARSLRAGITSKARRVTACGLMMLCALALVGGIGAQNVLADEPVDQAAQAQDDQEVKSKEDISAYTATVPASDVADGADGDIVVTVDAPAGAFDKPVELHAAALDDAESEDAASQLDEAKVGYDGFVALDVYFTDAEGNEIEPSGEVSVRFELPAGLVPDGAENLSVQHLAEDESGQIASVETVADAADETDGTVSVAEEGVAAEFSVDGFSSFTITWSQGWSTYFQVTVNYVDENGDAIPGTQTSNISIGSDTNISFAEEYAGNIDGYTFVGARYGAYDAVDNDVSSMTAEQTGPYYNPTRRLRFYDESGNETHTLTYNRQTQTATVYLVYQEVQQDLYINDTIESDGLFSAEFSDNVNVPDDASVEYTWFRSLTGAEDSWEKVALQRVTGTEDNLVNDGQAVSVAYDSIAAGAGSSDRYYYYVTATVTATDGSQTTYTSDSLQVPYYIALQNGSFENPVADHWNNQVSNGTEGLIWQTTGEGASTGHDGADVEIVRSTTGDYFLDQGRRKTYQQKVEEIYSPESADDGVQFAELNCEAYGALYQDVLTVPGADLNWYLSHCARQGQDTMALVIMPTSMSSALTDTLESIAASNQSNDHKAQAIRDAINSYRRQDGVYVEYFTDGMVDWERYVGEYQVGDNQYLTRFFFVAVSTGSGNATVGNLLDRVGFGTDVPPAEADEGVLTFTKSVNGIIPSEDYQVVVKVDADGDSQYDQSVALTDFRLNSETGSYDATASIRFENMTAHNHVDVQVSETVSGAPSGYSESSSVSIDGGSPVQGTSVATQVVAGEAHAVTFTNSYERDQVLGLSIEKVDESGNPLPNAYFALYEDTNDNDSYDAGTDALAENLTSDLEGGETLTQDGFGTVLNDESSAAIASFYGLEEGTYFIVETKAPAGYQLAPTATLVVAYDGDKPTFTINETPIDQENIVNGVATYTITDYKIDELPTSGSSGTIVLSTAGVATVAVAVYVLGRKIRITR